MKRILIALAVSLFATGAAYAFQCPADMSKIDDEVFPFRVTPVPTWEQARAKYTRAREENYYVLAQAYGPHEACWRLHGFTETLMDLALDPDVA